MHIIQDFLKIINNRLSWHMVAYFAMVFMLIIGFMIGRVSNIEINKPELQIVDPNGNIINPATDISSGTYDSTTTTGNFVDDIKSDINLNDNSSNGTSLVGDSSLDYNNSNSHTIGGTVGAAYSVDHSLIFGSSKGKYFYYKGCGGTTISKKNLVYYKSESDALAKGKVLYNKCN